MVVLLPAGVLAEGRSKARSGGSRPQACALVDWSELPGVASTSGHATTYRTAQRMLQALHEKLLGCSAAHEACKGRHTCHHEFLCVSDYWFAPATCFHLFNTHKSALAYTFSLLYYCPRPARS